MRYLLFIFAYICLFCSCSDEDNGTIISPLVIPELSVTGGELSRDGDTVVIVSMNHVSISPFVTDDTELRNAIEHLIYVSDKIRQKELICSWFKFINEYDTGLGFFNKIILIVYPNETGGERNVPFDVVSDTGLVKTSFVQSK